MKIIYSIGIACLAASTASAAPLPPAEAPEIVSGVHSCLSATNASQVDTGKLITDGWSVAKISESRKSVKTPVTIMSKGNLLLIPQTAAAVPTCAIMAKIGTTSAAGAIEDALDADLHVSRKSEDGKEIPAYWFPDGHIIQMVTTGTEGSPGLRIAVGYRK